MNASTFTIKDPTQIRTDLLRTIENAFARQGIAIDVKPGSEYWLIADAFANELGVAQANAAIKADELMPDTALDEALDRVLAIFTLLRRPAVGSEGAGALEASASTLIPANTELIDSAGYRYRVSTSGAFNPGDAVPIESVDVGAQTERQEGSVLKWVTPPAYAAPTMKVLAPGLTGGKDTEVNEVARSRLFARLRVPPASGNWQHVAELAEEATPAVQKAFVYPTLEGPATMHVAVTATPSERTGRRLPDQTVNLHVAPYILGNVPEHVYTVVTSVVEVPVVTTFALALPMGKDGGWLDTRPFPLPTQLAPGLSAAVVRSGLFNGTRRTDTRFVIATPNLPMKGASRLAWLAPPDPVLGVGWQLYTATVIDFLTQAGTPGHVEVALDRPFPNIPEGAVVWPECSNQQAYVDAVLEAFAMLGPGEKSSLPNALEWAYRRPPPTVDWPTTLGAHILRAISDAGPEVGSAAYLARVAQQAPAVQLTADFGPSPTNPQTAPNILVPLHIGFYPA